MSEKPDHDTCPCHPGESVEQLYWDALVAAGGEDRVDRKTMAAALPVFNEIVPPVWIGGQGSRMEAADEVVERTGLSFDGFWWMFDAVDSVHSLS